MVEHNLVTWQDVLASFNLFNCRSVANTRWCLSQSNALLQLWLQVLKDGCTWLAVQKCHHFLLYCNSTLGIFLTDWRLLICNIWTFSLNIVGGPWLSISIYAFPRFLTPSATVYVMSSLNVGSGSKILIWGSSVEDSCSIPSWWAVGCHGGWFILYCKRNGKHSYNYTSPLPHQKGLTLFIMTMNKKNIFIIFSAFLFYNEQTGCLDKYNANLPSGAKFCKNVLDYKVEFYSKILNPEIKNQMLMTFCFKTRNFFHYKTPTGLQCVYTRLWYITDNQHLKLTVSGLGSTFANNWAPA